MNKHEDLNLVQISFEDLPHYIGMPILKKTQMYTALYREKFGLSDEICKLRDCDQCEWIIFDGTVKLSVNKEETTYWTFLELVQLVLSTLPNNDQANEEHTNDGIANDVKTNDESKCAKMIYAIFNHPDNGTIYDKEQTAVLNIGHKYKLTGAAVGNWHTDIYIDGFNNSFNSVMFDFVDEDNSYINIINIPKYQMYQRSCEQ